MGYKVAVIGARTLIGQSIIDVLVERDIDVETFFPITLKKQSGHEISFGESDYKTLDHDGFNYAPCDYIFLCDPKITIKSIGKTSAKIIDCSGQSALENENSDNIIPLPTMRSTQLIEALRPLQKYAPIKHVNVTAFESTSAQGRDGMDELFNQSRKFFVHDAMEHAVFSKQIAYNIIPQVDEFMDDGHTHAEWLLNAETKRFLDKSIKLSATCTYVPVFVGTSMSVTVEFDGEIDKSTAKDLWRSNNNTVVIDRGSEMEYVSPVEIAGEDQIFISRVREDTSVDNGLIFWCVCDTVRMSAILAVEKLETLTAS